MPARSEMRLILATKDFPPDVGGIQTWSLELGVRFAARCKDFLLIAPKLPGCEEVDRGLPFEVLRVGGTRNTFATGIALKLGGVLEKRPFDSLLGAQWQTAMPGLALRGRGSLRHVHAAVVGRELLTRHFAAVPYGAAAFARARLWTLRNVDGMFPISHYTEGLVRELGVSTARSKIILNGCNTERFQPVDASGLRAELGLEGRKVLLSVCRLVPRKGVDTVLEALPEIRRHVPDAVYVIGGEGPDRARLEARARELNVSEHVRFLGYFPKERLPELYSSCDVFVLGAREERPDVEGFGLVLLEANACGKPAVATRSGGVGDAIAHGETGLVVDPTSGALAAGVVKVLTDAALSQRMRENSRARVLRCATWDRVADEFLTGMAQFSG